MEQEHYISGYCRCLDGSRVVEVITLDGRVTEVDCLYGSCAFQGSCPIAHRIDELNNG